MHIEHECRNESDSRVETFLYVLAMLAVGVLAVLIHC